MLLLREVQRGGGLSINVSTARTRNDGKGGRDGREIEGKEGRRTEGRE